MAKRIEGITIEFEGDTSGLNQALRSVDKDIKDVNTELRQVDRLLKFDPSNTDLLAQRMELLGNNVRNTETRLDALRQAQDQVNQQFERGEIGADQYRRFQREIIQTTNQLEGLRRAQANTDERIQLNVDASGLDRAKKAISDLASTAREAGSSIGDSLTKGAKVAGAGIAGIGVASAGAVAGVGAFVEANKELNMDLARLRTNAEQANFGVEEIEQAFLRVSSVSGEADSAVETISNLLATNIDEGQLPEYIDLINGATIRFSDTLKSEGIADGLQETFATGEAIGQFGELLERSGVDLEVFNAGLAKASANGTETDYVLQQLSQLGLGETYNAYLENNEALAKYNEEQGALQLKLAEVSTALTPVASTFLELGNTILDVVLGNTSLTDGFNRLIEIIGNVGTKIAGVAQEIIPRFIQALATALPKILEFGVSLIAKLIEGLTTTAPNLYVRILGILTELIRSLQSRLPEILQQGVAIVTKLIQGISNALPRVVASALTLIVTLAGALIRNLPQIISAGVQIIGAIIRGLGNALGQLISYVAGTLIPRMIRSFNVNDFVQLGKDLILGLIRGIGSLANSAFEAIGSVAKGVISSAKKIFRTRSPSKEFIGIGDDVGTGLAIGITGTTKKNTNAIEDVGKVIISVTNKNAKEVTEISKKAGEERAELEKKFNADYAKTKKKDNDARAKLQSDFSKKINEINKKEKEDIAKVNENFAKESIDALDKYIKDRKDRNDISLKEEGDFWRAVTQVTVKGSATQNEALKRYQDNVNAIRSNLNTTNQQFIDRAKKIDEDLIKNTEQASKEYIDQYRKRYDGILNFYSLFDEVRKEEAVTGEELLNNQQAILESLIDYDAQLVRLENRGVSNSLIEELRQQGIGEIENLRALNTLTDEQLKQFDDTFQARARIARERTDLELAPLASTTAYRIEEMQKTATRELDALNVEWQKEIKRIINGTEQQFTTLHQVGRDAGQGLINGLSSISGDLQKKAQELARSVSQTIRKELDINSPSVVTTELGEFTGQGFLNGLNNVINGVTNASSRLANASLNARDSLNSASFQAKANQYVNQQISQNTNVQGLDQLLALLSQFVNTPMVAQVLLDGNQLAEATYQRTGQLQNSQLNRQGITRGV